MIVVSKDKMNLVQATIALGTCLAKKCLNIPWAKQIITIMLKKSKSQSLARAITHPRLKAPRGKSLHTRLARELVEITPLRKPKNSRFLLASTILSLRLQETAIQAGVWVPTTAKDSCRRDKSSFQVLGHTPLRLEWTKVQKSVCMLGQTL